MDMRFCISNLDAIRAEAGDFTLKDFSDYWAPDNEKTAPNLPNTFVPNRIVIWAEPDLVMTVQWNQIPIIPRIFVSRGSC
jgi:hypothetical protein